MGGTAQRSHSIATWSPELAAELIAGRDGADARNLSPGSSRRVWWRCPHGHEWQAAVKSRVRGSGCPVCKGRIASAETSLAAVRPELAAEWHNRRNGLLTPQEVLPGSARRVWWRCSTCAHEWCTRVSSRSRGTGCPRCARRGRKGIRLIDVRPNVREEWVDDRNGPFDPTIVAGSERRFWWRCCEGHEWEAQAAQRSRGQGCPYCAHKRVVATDSLAIVAPLVAAEWDTERNGSLTPSDVTYASSHKAWWRCTKNAIHVWQAAIRQRTVGGNACPYCAGTRVSAETSLLRLRPDLVREWHPNRNDTSPVLVSPGSGIRAWWRCAAGHEWRARIVDRSARGVSCPYCAHQLADEQNCLAAEAPDVAAEWHPTKNGELSPRQVLTSSNVSVWWLCREGHEWKAEVGQRTRWSTNCPRCASSAHKGVTLADARPELALEWLSDLNASTAENTAAGSHRRVWWRCSNCSSHVWQAPVRNRTKGNTGCPYCAGKRPTPRNNLATEATWLVREWHPHLNDDLSPTDLLPHSVTTVWWFCKRKHAWQASPRDRQRGSVCRLCSEVEAAAQFREKHSRD
jgi:hypothetical protein